MDGAFRTDHGKTGFESRPTDSTECGRVRVNCVRRICNRYISSRSSSSRIQAVIVITDGVDEHSRLDQLIDLVRSQRAQLFLIGLPSRPEFRFFDHFEPKVAPVTGHDIDNPDVVSIG